MQQLAELSLADRLNSAVNVSGARDNCFFHAYAAYLLSNKLPLPADLFTPVPGNENISVEQLKTVFKNEQDLEVFKTQRQLQNSEVEPSEMLLEKTLVLGVLFRDWFSRKLLQNEAHKDRLFDQPDNENAVSFIKVIEAFREVGAEALRADARFAPIYEANIAFFNRLGTTDEPVDFQAYWNEEGYKNYCDYLAKPHVKIAYTDMMPVLESLEVPYTIYSKQDASITATSGEDNHEKPRLDLAIAGGEGHYYLLKDSHTEAALNDYAASLAQYIKDREAILQRSTPEEKSQACKNAISPLVSMIIPDDFLPMEEDPIELLVQRVKQFQSEGVPIPSHHEVTSSELTEKEKEVINATALTQKGMQKQETYKIALKELIEARKNNGLFKDINAPIPTNDLDSAEGLEGESDEDFAKRLQEAEFRKAGLK